MPSAEPTSQPTEQPSKQPTSQPSGAPSGQPTIVPTTEPTGQPSVVPSGQPSKEPTGEPTSQPSRQPSSQPTNQPSSQPTNSPSVQPSNQPSGQPSCQPTSQPTRQPTATPSGQPSGHPTSPSAQPTDQPTNQPSGQPTDQPSGQPTVQPSSEPSLQPTGEPSYVPTVLAKCPLSDYFLHGKVVNMQVPEGWDKFLSLEPDGWNKYLERFKVVIVSNKTFHNRIDVAISVSEVGKVICALYKSDTVPKSITELLSHDSRSLVYGHSGLEVSNISFYSVEPDTGYQVYCASRSVHSLMYTGIADVVGTGLSVKSLGSKSVTVNLLDGTFLRGMKATKGITITLNAAPSGRMNVSVEAVRANDNYITPFYPLQSNVLDQSSWSDGLDFVFQPNASGLYWINITLSGHDVDEYDVLYPEGASFSVLQDGAEPPVPVLVSARFDSDGLSILITFSKMTNKAGLELSSNFGCALLLDFPFASSSQCYWRDASVVIIIIDENNRRITDGDNVTLLGGEIRALCNLSPTECLMWDTVNQSVVGILPPTDPHKPRVMISAPSFVSAGRDLSIDISLSSGALGKPWKSLSITVSSTNSSAVGLLRDFLDSVHDSSLFPLPISHNMLSANSSYDFVVRLCNVYDLCGTGVQSVTVSGFVIPTVLIQGPKVLTIPSKSSLFLQSSISFGAFTDVIPSEDVVYSWCVNSNERRDSTITSTAVSATNFLIKPYTLVSKAIYEVILTVSYQNMSSYHKTIVVVEEAKLMAAISGPVERSVQLGQSVEVDASGSSWDDSDPNGNIGALSTTFTYVWSCYVLEPYFSPHCNDFGWYSNDLWNRKYKLSTNLTNSELVGFKVRASVAVMDEESHKHDKASVTIAITRASGPTIAVSSKHANNVVNPSDRVSLTGVVQVYQNEKPERFTWSIDDEGVPLQDIALTNISRAFSLGIFEMNLVLRLGSLNFRAQPYLFSLTSPQEDGSMATGSISIRMNQRPVLGNFTVSPSSGTTLVTFFKFLSTNWEDSDLPLSYSFGYVSQTELPNLLRRQVKFNFMESVLPRGRGRSVNKDSLQCLNYIFDSIGAQTTKYTAVKVYETTAAVSLVNNTNKLFEESAGDAELTKAVILLTSSSVNFVNCSNAPDCASLSRRECSRVEHTCGECIDGTSGEGGDLNTKCLTDSDFEDYKENANTIRSCFVDSDCFGWEECVQTSLSTQACQRAVKRCENDCNSHGDCIYLHISTGLNLSTCMVGESACEALCNCHDGYTGEYCGIRTADVEVAKNVTLLLLRKTEETMGSEEHDLESIINLLVILESVVQSPFLLSRESIRLSFDILEQLFSLLSNEISLSTEKLSRVGNVFDTLLRSLSGQLVNSDAYCPDPLVDEFVVVFTQFENLISRNLIPGQYPFNIVTRLLRSSTQSQDSVVKNVTLAIPLSELESKVDVKPSDIVSDSVFPDSVFTVASKLYGECGSDFTSNPTKFGVDIDLYSNGNNVSFQLTAELTNNVGVEYPVEPTTEKRTTECITGDFSEYTYTCPIQITRPSPYASYSNITVKHQCQGIAEIIQTNCPVVSLRSQCIVLESDLNISCHEASYTSDFTACDCWGGWDSSESSSRLQSRHVRRLQSDDSGENFMVVTQPLIVVEDTVITTAPIAYSPEVAPSVASLSFVISFFGIWFSVLIITAKFAKLNEKKVEFVVPEDQKDILRLMAPLQGRKDLVRLAKDAVLSYVIGTIPNLYAGHEPLRFRMSHEFFLCHRYFSLLSWSPTRNGATSDVLSMIQMMLVQCVLFLCCVLFHLLQVCVIDLNC